MDWIAEKGSRGEWYAVYCKAREENRAAAHLENQGMSVLCPCVRHRRKLRGAYRAVVEPMFPRYVFLRLGREDNPAVVRSTRGAVGLVRFGNFTPPVPAEVIDRILHQSDEQGCLDLQAGSEFQSGEAIRVVEGPFAGAEALFEARSGKDRVAVLLEIMQRQRRIEISECAIAKA